MRKERNRAEGRRRNERGVKQWVYACVEESLVSRLEADGVGKRCVRNLHSSGSTRRGLGTAGEREGI